MTAPGSRDREAVQFTLISWVMRFGVYLSLVFFSVAAALRILRGGWEGPYLPASALLSFSAWNAPGDALLWAGVLVLGLTPLTTLFVVLVFSLIHRRAFDAALAVLIFLLFVVSALLGA